MGSPIVRRGSRSASDALRDRLPQVAERLRDGRISAERVTSIIARTDLVDGHDCAAVVDADIAACLDLHEGAWSVERLRDMVDRIVYRHDPDAVRERRQKAVDARGVSTRPLPDGMAKFSATMSAENACLSDGSVKALAACACEHDPRTTQQRRSDATFALLTGTAFECECRREDCDAVIPEPGAVALTEPKVVIHVVVDESTLNGDADNAGYIAGHGVISDEHARDLAARPDAVIKPLVPKGTPENLDGSFTVAAHLPSDPYRPTAALDTFVRIRDGSSVIPGSEVSAFDADLDHVEEFDHDDPASGGHTLPDNLNAKDRFWHLLKTFGDWVDDQYRDRHGALRTEFITPEGLVIPGDPENLDILFPGLRRIRFKVPPGDDADPSRRSHARSSGNENRSTSRVAAKHARRRRERERNRQRREAEDETSSQPIASNARSKAAKVSMTRAMSPGEISGKRDRASSKSSSPRRTVAVPASVRAISFSRRDLGDGDTTISPAATPLSIWRLTVDFVNPSRSAIIC
ncbi:DUF222 domain-containing protein [Gordonia sp. SL306]|uniref:DUF222 domain-containing protein n=1 Tax=Gordonia sp. SL306 TaxID=2995145 RepID=UPI003B634865